MTGIVEPPPNPSTFDFDTVVTEDTDPSESGWNNARWNTFSLLKPGADIGMFGKDVDLIIRENGGAFEQTKYSAVPLDDIYLSPYFDAGDVFGRKRLMQIFGIIGLLTLLVAAVNFVNLAYAESTRRATSVGVRRSLGATQSQVGLEAAVEPLVSGLTALVLSLVIVGTVLYVSIPLFGDVQSGLANDLGIHVLNASVVAGSWRSSLRFGAWPDDHGGAKLPAARPYERDVHH